ncbi:hypothetical protein MLD38_037497 [Melastoma candidum]|uniref:Uncharacterized protein n=1 Tax=Melastoma candidum TaxID=119954 RepID=A0ACB9LN84_9MYRT|nr:hypothetical protein MLD38_037497 [Melastoma candidum]
MSEAVNLSINGQSQVPPGFRFHPTEEELLHYYLRKKVAYEKIDLDVIREVDLNKLEPWDIQEKCRIGSTPQNDWYFFSHKDKKYPTGTRTNRATAAGFWKATGRDKIIYSGFRRIGLRKTLVFYKGRAPHGQKSDWIMHEYRLDESSTAPEINALSSPVDAVPEEGWVVCRVFKKKNYTKTLDSPKSPPGSYMETKLHMPSSGNDVVLDHILSYMGRTCKPEHDTLNKINVVPGSGGLNKLLFPSCNPGGEIFSSRFMHLPRLDSSFDPHDSNLKQPPCYPYQPYDEVFPRGDEAPLLADRNGMITDWAALDRLVASQLNGPVETSSPKQLSCFSDDPSMSIVLGHHDDDEVQFSSQMRLSRPEHQLNQDHHQNPQLYGSKNDLWTFPKSTSSSPSDPLRHLSV